MDNKPFVRLARVIVFLTCALPAVALDPFMQQAFLKAPQPTINSHYGTAVAMSGNTLPILAYSPAAVYTFVRNASGWVSEAVLSVNGSSLALSGDTMVIGASGGAADVFVRNAGVWAREAVLTPPHPEQYSEFGSSVAVSGDTVVVGAPYESRTP